MDKSTFYQELFSTVLGYSLDLYAYIDTNNTYQYVSDSYAHFYDFDLSKLIGQSPSHIFDENTYNKVIEPNLTKCKETKAPVNYQSWIIAKKSQEPHFLYVSYLPHIAKESGELVGIIVIARDVTEFKRAESLLSESANTDALTDIPNRLYLENKLQELTKGGHRASDRFALLFIDLDGFKAVNDDYGHAVGDKVLYQVARRISKHIRKEDILTRYGGDEFVILITPLVDSKVIQIVQEKIERSINQPFEISGNKINIGVSVGASIFPDETTKLKELINTADQRMYENKNKKNSTD